ncbi:transcription factor SKN7-like [Schistocerca americana]|uniref:transcription factor SKN7-like n=1 Tax=Schistocerca americana TaxID=7009 RepID=UPI001F503BC9|nr:transcription factor SKN7-like [Schistocerca americana]
MEKASESGGNLHDEGLREAGFASGAGAALCAQLNRPRISCSASSKTSSGAAPAGFTSFSLRPPPPPAAHAAAAAAASASASASGPHGTDGRYPPPPPTASTDLISVGISPLSIFYS